MKAHKENRVYTITEAEVEAFRKEGYDIYDDSGNLVTYGAGKSVPFERYMHLQELYEGLLEENVALVEANAKLEAKLKEKKSKAKDTKK